MAKILTARPVSSRRMAPLTPTQTTLPSLRTQRFSMDHESALPRSTRVSSLHVSLAILRMSKANVGFGQQFFG